MAEREFPPHLFVDPSRASRNLATLDEIFIGSGSRYAVEDFSRAVLHHLGGSPDPDMSLTNVLRFAEASFHKGSLFNDLVQYGPMMDALFRILGSSQYFADILVRDPGLFRWLMTSGVLTAPLTRKSLDGEISRVFEAFLKPERRLDALKRLHRRELLRIGSQDVLGSHQLESITGQLSVLADALTEAAFRVACDQLRAKGLVAPAAPFAVLALGKLGGGELNYSSDIDIMFVYDDTGSGGRMRTCLEYFNRLAERVVQNLSQPSTEGYLYRVDTRLRPESGAGPLARSLRSCLLYYESRGELWERQMLLKARPVAGDLSLGAAFLRLMEPFVYPRTFFHHPAESIARLKLRIEAEIGREENVKLMPGGIRDIEFIAQALQMLNGGKNRDLRTPNTLDALTRLTAHTLLAPLESKHLHEAYIFLRTLEHRLQTMLNTQTHALPAGSDLRASLARRMGLSSAQELDASVNRHRTAVRRIFDEILSVRSPAAEIREGGREAGLLAVLDGGLGDDSMQRMFTQYGIRELREAAKNLRILVAGTALTASGDLDARTHEAFRAIAGVLFDDIARTPDPDLTLNDLTMLVAAQRFPHQMYTQLADIRFRKFVLTVCSLSPRFTRALARSPLGLETLASDGPSLAERTLIIPSRGADLVDFKHRQELIIGIRHLLGFTSFEEMSADLARLADGVLAVVLEEEGRRGRWKGAPLTVFALGKYGSEEMNLDADLDLFFVTDPAATGSRDSIARLAERMLGRLTEMTDRGKLYDVDARLRPEGKNAPLVVEANAYVAYLRDRASLWERQSLTRLRFVCGGQPTARALTGAVEEFVYGRPLPSHWVDSVVAMRRKMETRSRVRSGEFFDIKLGPGGMADVEFLAQMMKLKFGVRRPEVRPKKVLQVLSTDGLPFKKHEVSALTAAYTMFRELEKLTRITLEERTSILPEGLKLERLARCYGRIGGRELQTRVASMMKEVRSLFLTLSRRCA